MPKQEDPVGRVARLANEAATLCRLSAMQHERIGQIAFEVSEIICRDDPSQRTVLEPLLAETVAGMNSQTSKLRELADIMDSVSDP